MIAMAGLAARVQTLIDLLNGTVTSAIREVPWAVTALPAARQSSDAARSIFRDLFIASVGSKTDLAADTTLQTLVSVTGSGYLEHAHVWGGTTTGTVRLVIEADGVEILDATGASVSALRILSGCGVIGGNAPSVTTTGMAICEAWRVPFRATLVIKAQQSATAIDADLLYRYTLAEPYTA